MPRIIGELTRFGTVGVIAYVIDVALFNLLLVTSVGASLGTASHPIAAKAISVTIAVIVSWIGNRYWTYRAQRGRTKRGELALFLLANLAGMAVSLGCLVISHYMLQLTSPLADNISANVVGLALGTALRWWLYRTYVFSAGAGGGRARGSRQL
ncbi:MAG TPA: GtrA family protein [Actinomycetales bacterium]|nr:GtrA family protein [Actinomycetales bacterium]